MNEITECALMSHIVICENDSQRKNIKKSSFRTQKIDIT